MSLWWAKREQLDPHQVALIEDLPLDGSHLVIGPPGSGKTNVLLRRAQFTRFQNRPNVLVLTFTRPLTEFLRTGCHTSDGRELFPPALLNTYEGWQRALHKSADQELPDDNDDFLRRRADLALSSIEVLKNSPLPKFDGVFVDEAQDLIPEEVELIKTLSDNLFWVGDDHQRIYGGTSGLKAIRSRVSALTEHKLPFHYRLAAEICEVADRIQVASGVASLASTQHYDGPKPGRVHVEGPLSRGEQIERAISRLREQIRVYGDLIQQGDKLGVVVPRKSDRDEVFEALEDDDELSGLSQVVRARSGEPDDRDYNPEIDPEKSILILTAQGTKGLEFRAVQWLFSDDLENYYTPEIYYTVVTRAKTSLDIYFTNKMATQIAKAYAKPEESIW